MYSASFMPASNTTAGNLILEGDRDVTFPGCDFGSLSVSMKFPTYAPAIEINNCRNNLFSSELRFQLRDINRAIGLIGSAKR